MYIYKVGVVGAGTMGAQIAEVVSYAGVPVLLADSFCWVRPFSMSMPWAMQCE